MNNLPFDKPGRFWRGNLHTHSTQSDGRLTPENVCQFYQEAGYDFIALTDHFLERYNFPITNTLSFHSADFTTILGAELHAGHTEIGNMWHILAVGLPLDFRPPAENETGPQIAHRALDAGAFVAMAHPHWYILTEADAISLGPVHAIEVFNATAVDHNDRPSGLYLLDLLLARGRRYLACATDDAHFVSDRYDYTRGWVWVKGETLSSDSILRALKAGEYYSSTGPKIHDIQVIPGQHVRVRCSPANAIFAAGRGAVSARVYGNGLTEATLSLNNFDSPYCRITVRDGQGGRAWSNPIWFDT